LSEQTVLLSGPLDAIIVWHIDSSNYFSWKPIDHLHQERPN